MKKVRVIVGAALACGMLQAQVLKVGTGASELADAKAAGAEAAAAAKAALGDTPAKAVIVFAARAQVNAELVEGVAQHFGKPLICGCEGYSPLTCKGNFAERGHGIPHGVAVLALGGDTEVTVAAECVLDGGFAASGEKLGVALKEAAQREAKSRLVLTFGNQHVGENQPLMDGFYKGLGVTLPVVGAAAGGQDAKEIVKGEVVTGVNVAVLLSGAYSFGVGLAGGGGDLAQKAAEAFAAATTAHGGKPVVAFVFDCGGRRGDMFKQKTLAAEFEAMRKAVPDAALFGFYGGGEIGTADAGERSRGVGFHIAVATLYE
ncbi:MAG: FIST C-terminal domain-containing protein [Kiritimatiellaeota bacterium]|nr:FIST C-terminal domain-containing protein [Kiritimatiellota bacterium]